LSLHIYVINDNKVLFHQEYFSRKRVGVWNDFGHMSGIYIEFYIYKQVGGLVYHYRLPE